MNYIVLGLLCFVIGITLARLFPYIKDRKITSSEKEKIQAIIIDAIKSIVLLSSDIPSKNKLIMIVTNSIVTTIEENQLDGFTEEEIEQMVTKIIDKLNCNNINI